MALHPIHSILFDTVDLTDIMGKQTIQFFDLLFEMWWFILQMVKFLFPAKYTIHFEVPLLRRGSKTYLLLSTVLSCYCFIPPLCSDSHLDFICW